MKTIQAQPLTAAAFAPFGDVLDIAGDPDKIINAGLCGRFHDRAALDFGPDGRAGISLFNAEPRALPYTLTLLERHPEGSQAFVPMHTHPWLVIVAQDAITGTDTASRANDRGDRPGDIHAFLVPPGTAVNLHRGTWHGVLTPLASPGLFAVIDRIGTTPNLEENPLSDPILITGSVTDRKSQDTSG